MDNSVGMSLLNFNNRRFLNPLPPKANGSFSQINKYRLPAYVYTIDQLISKVTSAAMKDVVILQKINLKHKNEKLQKCTKPPNVLGIPLECTLF